MSRGSKDKPEGLLGLTQNEARLILLGVLYSDNTGKVDFEKIAEKAPYKNSASASVSYRNAKRRFESLHDFAAGDSGSPTPTTTPIKTTPAKRKRGRPASVDPDAANDAAIDYGAAIAEGGEEASPAPKQKRQRKTPAKKDVAIKTEPQSEQDTPSDPINTFCPTPNPQDFNNTIIKTEPDDSPTKTNLQSEEEQVMTELNVDAEFADMERSQKITGVRDGSAWLGSLPG
ncbi:putative histone h1.3 [Aspergillus undulatus]|uniref:putative histone h1.3 n=1 Tax=Aspergillus undulatus TaxID=1810928 RepID=UPI003CCCA7D4